MSASVLGVMLSTLTSKTARDAYDFLDARLGEYGFPAEGARRFAALKTLHPALMLHMEGDPSPVPPRHAFIDSSGEVRIETALNSNRIETETGVVLYMNLRSAADFILKNSA